MNKNVKMKRIVYSLLVLTVMMLFVSCDDYETYGEKSVMLSVLLSRTREYL